MTEHNVTEGSIWNEQTRSHQHTAACSCTWETVNVTRDGLSLEIAEHVGTVAPGSGRRPRGRVPPTPCRTYRPR